MAVSVWAAVNSTTTKQRNIICSKSSKKKKKKKKLTTTTTKKVQKLIKIDLFWAFLSAFVATLLLLFFVNLYE